MTWFAKAVQLVLGLAARVTAHPAIRWDLRSTKATVAGTRLKLYTYKPRCENPGLLVVFHGTLRNAGDYRDSAIPFADRACMMVTSPMFEERRFPPRNYQRGGIVDDDDGIRPIDEWTTRYVAPLIAWSRASAGRADAPVYLFGHSAGGQFLSRVAAYQPPADVMRFVIANPSTHVRASLTEDAPYGFRGLPDGTALLRQYLALPITIYLGEADEDPSDPDLSTASAAMEQGPHRLARGRFVYAEAKDYARNNDLPFNWRLVISPEVGHTADGMLRSAAAPLAFAP